MGKQKYRARLIDTKIKEYLDTFGAICIEGPKWCGKTWTSQHHAKSSVYLGDPVGGFQNRTLAQLNPSLILEGEQPRLIDEWQEVPPLWDAVRHKVDESHQKGQFILTGSATPNHKGILHSGAGRIARLRMHPMSLYESGNSSGTVSLQSLFQNSFKDSALEEVPLKQLVEFIIRGGWPGSLDLSFKQASLVPKEYLNAIIQDDVFRLDGIKRNTNKMMLLLKSLARNESTSASNKTIRNDIKEIDDEDIDANTVASYIDIFTRLFLIDNQAPFSHRLRSRLRIKQAEKRHFCDPSLAASLLGASVDALINDLQTLGFLFEALCVRDLKIYAESFNAQVFHYQDYENNEIDAVVQAPDGAWGAFEIKLGHHEVDEAAKKLIRLKEKLQDPENPHAAPSLLCVITGLSKAAYRRADGVYTVPITSLKP